MTLVEKEQKERKEEKKKSDIKKENNIKKEKKEKEKENTQRKVTLNDVLTNILTHNVSISNEEYERMLTEVSTNYDKLHDTKDGETAPTLDERRKRIEANYYGTAINFAFATLNTLNDFIENYAPLIEAIAEKVGVDFEKKQSAEEKAMEAAAAYLNAKTQERLASREKATKNASNSGEVIKFDKK